MWLAEVRKPADVSSFYADLCSPQDLCEANGVKGYPQMNLYKNGEFHKQFKGSREMDRLLKFVEAHAQPKTPRPQSASESEEPAKETSAAERPAQTTFQKKLPNPTGSVQSLTIDNFLQVVNSGPVFVKFFAPWCVLIICPALLRKLFAYAYLIGVVIVKSLPLSGRN